MGGTFISIISVYEQLELLKASQSCPKLHKASQSYSKPHYSELLKASQSCDELLRVPHNYDSTQSFFLSRIPGSHNFISSG